MFWAREASPPKTAAQLINTAMSHRCMVQLPAFTPETQHPFGFGGGTPDFNQHLGWGPCTPDLTKVQALQFASDSQADLQGSKPAIETTKLKFL